MDTFFYFFICSYLFSKIHGPFICLIWEEALNKTEEISVLREHTSALRVWQRARSTLNADNQGEIVWGELKGNNKPTQCQSSFKYHSIVFI